MKHNNNTCTECGNDYRVEHDWKRNCDDELVCENCADELPTFSINKLCNFSFYGNAEHGSLKSSVQVSSGCHETEEKARTEILQLVRKLWGADIKPIEEGEL